MDEVRYLTRASGFLSIGSHEKNRYMAFDRVLYTVPKNDWRAPHPYCPDDVLFPIDPLEVGDQLLEQLPVPVPSFKLQEQVLWEQLLGDENLGG
jgi:hypothetical protein